MYLITLTKTQFIKDGRNWSEVKKVTRTISEKEYHNITSEETKRFFNRLGGIERHTKGYTYAGYITTKVNSISPDRQQKSVYDFDIKMKK